MRDSIQEFGPECWEELDSVTRSGVRPIDDNCYCAAVLNEDQGTSKHNEMIGGTRAGCRPGASRASEICRAIVLEESCDELRMRQRRQMPSVDLVDWQSEPFQRNPPLEFDWE
jgi:hypothetical protein